MAAMRLELEATKQQLENAFQVNLNQENEVSMITVQANSSVSDADKEERKAMERKLEEMEEKLQVEICIFNVLLTFLPLFSQLRQTMLLMESLTW